MIRSFKCPLHRRHFHIEKKWPSQYPEALQNSHSSCRSFLLSEDGIAEGLRAPFLYLEGWVCVCVCGSLVVMVKVVVVVVSVGGGVHLVAWFLYPFLDE
jgi:hypothetical protein